MKRSCIHQYESLKPISKAACAAHANRASPVVAEETDALQIQKLDERCQSLNMLIQRINISVLRLLRKTTSQMIDGDHTMVAT